MASLAFPSISTTTKVPSGTTYEYVHVEPKDNKPYILFLHGFPDSSYSWRKQIPYFSNLGYGLIVPDLLGYGGTDKPKEIEAYRLRKMSEEVVAILEGHNIKEVIGVGHDWGSLFLSRFVNYYPSLFSKLVFIDVGYGAPTGPFSVDAVNNISIKLLGYPIFGYWDFFNDADAGQLMDEHPESMRSLVYAADPMFRKDVMCPPNAMRTYITEGKTGPINPSASTEEMEIHAKILAMGGYGPPINWYKAQVANLNTADEPFIPDEDKHLRQPTLLITATKDPISHPAMAEGGMKDWVKNLTVKPIDSGHWVQRDQPDETNEALENFIKG